jgi:DNA mismatch repair ATPase MutL
LYGSPNKAVEELVANSFDAMAQNVYVYVPERFTERLLVWDDGESMDVAGLRAMWKTYPYGYDNDNDQSQPLTR